MTEPRANDSAGSKLAWLALLPAGLLVILMMAGPIVSGDLWWHLSTGEWMLENGELPEHDPFSHTAGDKAWTLEEYGSQILFALVNNTGGLGALRVVGALLGLLALVAAYRVARRELPPHWAVLLTALFALLFALKWELRPHLLSVFFFFRLQHLLFPSEHDRDPGKREWIEVFILTVVWVQLHGEAIFVPTLAIAGLIGAILAVVRNRESGPKRILAWVAILLVAALGSLCSPEGLDQVRYALSESSIPRELIEEWRPHWTLPSDPRFAPVTISLFVIVGLCAYPMAVFVGSCALAKLFGHTRRLSWERIGFLCACILLAVLARRFFWLLLFPMIDFSKSILLTLPSWKSSRVVPAVIALLLAVPLAQSHYATSALGSLRTETWSDNVHAGLLPKNATEFIGDCELEGNLFHRYEWGGFLGFHLWPECRVYLDGRTVLFAEVIPERWKIDNWKTYQPDSPDEEHGASFATRVLKERNVRLLVMPSLVNLGGRAGKWEPPGAHKAWIRVWEDDTAIVWLSATDEANLNRIRSWYAEHGIDFDAGRGFVEAQVISAQPDWIRERGLLAGAVREIVEPMLFGGPDGSVARWSPLARVETWLRMRMGRSARWELEQILAEQMAGDQKTYSAWMRLLVDQGPKVVYERLARGEQP